MVLHCSSTLSNKDCSFSGRFKSKSKDMCDDIKLLCIAKVSCVKGKLDFFNTGSDINDLVFELSSQLFLTTRAISLKIYTCI